MNESSMQEINEVYNFCASVGLPVCLSEIGIKEVHKEKLMKVARKSVEQGSSIHHEDKEVTAEMVYDALVKADTFGRKLASK